MTAILAFALASTLHAGFQLTVTILVYPVLGARPADEWEPAHARHSRAIAPVVLLVYAALLGTGAALVLAGPDLAGWFALVGAASALAVTAFAAAPLHGRLGARDDILVRRLLLADRWRCLAAFAGACAAVVAVWR